jgi:hypothetical protein
MYADVLYAGMTIDTSGSDINAGTTPRRWQWLCRSDLGCGRRFAAVAAAMDEVSNADDSLARSRPTPAHRPILRARRIVAFLLISIFGVYLSATAVRFYARNYYLFLPDYLRWTFTPAPSTSETKHLFVLFVDHFEPDMSVERTTDWLSKYEAMAAHHLDSAGRRPQHTWFYPGEQYKPQVLDALGTAVRAGLGEVELHYHHANDTRASLREDLQQAVERFQRHGFLKTVDGQTRYAFVHGNFGLDNSQGAVFCGVDDELSVLRETGAYVDHTFPAIYTMSQPRFVNQIYAAKDDPNPKSYNRRLPLAALNAPGEADLMVFEGPLVFAPSTRIRRLFLDLDNGDIHAAMPASGDRIDRWLRANVHVPGHEDWVFIRLFGHGASSPGDVEAVTGPGYDEMLSRFERDYNDGQRYQLHYVTAREAYNLVMAAVDGHSGDPRPYFDYRVKPYQTRALTAPPIGAE